MSAPQAIETRAYGCRFRSRLEARWAVFFTTMGWGWEFEPEGFELASGRYLPDFRLHHPDGSPRWFEVKPYLGPELLEDPRWTDVARMTGMPVLVAYGMHRRNDDCPAQHAGRFVTIAGTSARLGAFWQRPAYADAWNAASSARFEFGEAPQ